MTPAATARLMASMFAARGERIRLLDAGAAVGSLTAAWVAEICERKQKPTAVQLTAYELDEELADRLKGTLKNCQQTCDAAGVGCEAQLRREDFIEAGVQMLDGGFFSPELERFDAAILEPAVPQVYNRLAGTIVSQTAWRRDKQPLHGVPLNSSQTPRTRRRNRRNHSSQLL